MYSPRAFAETDLTGLDRLIERDAFVTLVTVADGLPFVSHLPVLYARDGDRIVIRAEADPPLTSPARVQVIRYLPEATVAIGRGENEGREVTYSNIVTDWRSVADWPGAEPIELTAEVAGNDPVVVIVQTQGPADVLAAALVK